MPARPPPSPGAVPTRLIRGRRLPQHEVTGVALVVGDFNPGAGQPRHHVWYTPGGEAGGGAYPAVTVSVTKKPGENAVDVARAARARVDELRNTVIPPGLEATVTRDYGQTAAEKAREAAQAVREGRDPAAVVSEADETFS